MKHGDRSDRRSPTSFGVASKCGDLQDIYFMSEVLVSPQDIKILVFEEEISE